MKWRSCGLTTKNPDYQLSWSSYSLFKPKGIYNPITAMGFSAMFTFQLDNTKM